MDGQSAAEVAEWPCPWCGLTVYSDDPNVIRSYHAPCYFQRPPRLAAPVPTSDTTRPED